MDHYTFAGVLLYSVLVHQATLVGAHTNCRKDWTEYSNYCYYFNTNSYTWDVAMQWCRDIVDGGDLASILSSGENSQIQGMINTNIHIGFTDLSEEGDWEWSDGRSVVYTNWNSGEPSGNSGQGNCAGMYTSGAWDDYGCDAARPFVCKVVKEWTAVQTGCQCYFDAQRFDCACCRNGGCNCGISNPNQCVLCGDAAACGQDYSGPIDHWKVVFKAVASLNSLSTADLWTGTGTENNGDTTAPIITDTTKNYKSSDANSWNTDSIQQIKFAFFDSGTEKMSLVFDASGTSKTSFYSASYLIYAPYTNVYTTSKNYFSITGHTSSTLGRHFFLSSYYNGCGGDAGWVIVSDPSTSSGGCDWDNRQTRPHFLYSSGTTHQAFVNMANAGTMAIFFKETVDTSDSELCDSGWTYFGNGCYKIYEDTKSWFDAVSACRALGDEMDLISIHSYDETMHALSMSRWTFSSTSYWIGAHDLNEEDTWEWIDGSPFDYTRWTSGEPSNGNGAEDCASLRWATDGTWNDGSCTDTKGYICKYPLDVASCGEWKRKGSTSNGYYTIDPDGPYNGVDPFRVYCDMTSEADAIHVFHHKQEARGHVNGYESAVSYAFDINYENGVTFDQMKAVIDISDNCYQYLKYECLGSIVKIGGNHYAAWYDRSGNMMQNWAGAPTGVAKCACGSEGTCTNNHATCNCDINDATWRYDDGTITDKDYLPVSKLGFGDTGSSGEEGFHTLGAFYCKGDSSDIFTTRSDFHLIPYSYISNNNNEVIGGITAAQCASECVARTTFTCRSFDFDGTCYLSEYNHIMNGGLSTGTANNRIYMRKFDQEMNLINEQETCTSGWAEYDGYCYYPSTTKKNWIDAETWCQGYGGHLTSTNDESEYDFLRLIGRWTASTEFSFLIGYNDIEIEGQWVEADGSNHSYTKWRSSEPNGENLENGVLMYARSSDDWIDANVETTRQFICKAEIGASSIPQPTVDPSCSTNWVSLGDSCYYFSTSTATYDNAQSACKAMDSDLVIIDSNAEWTFISHYMRYRYYTRHYWIGLTDSDEEGTWVWANGDHDDLGSHWLSGKPDDSSSSENCARFDKTNGYEDSSCTDSNYYICEDDHYITDAPNDIGVTVQSPSAAFFTWNDPFQTDGQNHDMIGVKLYYWKRDEQSSTTKSVTVNTTSTHSLEISTLTPGAEYEFHMVAYNSYGEGPASDPPLNFTMKEARVRTDNYVTSIYRITTGKRLDNHVILTTEAFNLQHCTNICSGIPSCQSVNFQVASVLTKKTCEINSSTKESHSGDLSNHNSYSYAGL